MIRSIAAVSLLVLASCAAEPTSTPPPAGKEAAKAAPQAPAPPPAEAPAPPQGEGHAEATFVPGSHEDWCAEHEVPESQCTRCNPALIPAFKAANDWCDVHGLPHSQDKQCKPDLVIERPPRPADAKG